MILRLLASAALAGVVIIGGLSWLVGSLGVRLARVIPNPSEDAAPPAEPLRLAAADGSRVAATFWPGARVDSPGVLLVPGLGAMHRRLTPNAVRFGAEGYAVLAIDLRGHGLSGPALHSFGWTESADVHAAFAWLKARQNGAKIAVVGISMGGAAALLGPAGPVGADAFVLQAVFADIRGAVRCRAALVVGNRAARVVEPFLSFQSLPRFGIWPSRLAPLAAVKTLERPLLVIGGERDIFVPPTEARSFVEAAPGARDLWIVPGVGHKGVSDLTSEAYQARVLGFLRERSGRPEGSVSAHRGDLRGGCFNRKSRTFLRHQRHCVTASCRTRWWGDLIGLG